jgi:NAD(P)H-dependent FMN reductase
MKIVFIVGSLRKGSFNRIIANYAAKALEGKAEVEWLDISEMPLYNADYSYPFPEADEKARELVSAADGLWIFNPEYNGFFTAPLKNALDILSLANVPGNFASGSPLKGKPVAISGAGGGFKSARSQEALLKLLGNIQAKAMTEPRVMIGLPATAFQTGEWTPTEEQIAEINAEAEAFLTFVKDLQK